MSGFCKVEMSAFLGAQGPQAGGEVPQERPVVYEFVSWNFLAPAPDIQDDFDHVFDVAWGVDAPGNGQADQVHGGVFGEHQRADFYGTNAAFEIKLDSECDTGKLRNRNMRQECSCIDINRVNLGEPAYDSSPRIMAAHCSVDIAEVPESVRRSMRIASESTRKRL
jgi:hypothetical protein